MGSDYGVPAADNLDGRITKYKKWLIPIQVRCKHTNVFPIISGGTVACSRFLASSGRGGEFTQPLPPILWEKRYLDCLTKQPNFSVQVAKLQVEGSSFLDYCALIRDAFISPSMVRLTNIWQQTCSPLASSPSFPPSTLHESATLLLPSLGRGRVADSCNVLGRKEGELASGLQVCPLLCNKIRQCCEQVSGNWLGECQTVSAGQHSWALYHNTTSRLIHQPHTLR